MAIFHFAAKVVSRAKGQSVIAKAAYNAREELTEERTGEVKDYTRAEGLLFSGIYAPAKAPAWAHDRAQLWNAADRAEKRKDSQLAREYEVALPHELTDEQRRFLVQDFIRENFARKGYAADVSIHAPDREGDERNYHAHILVTDRRLEADGFAADKKERQQSKAEMKAELEALRESWERTTNRHLERHGIDARIDRRSLKDQGIDKEPTQHLGPYATQLEREGEESERGNANRDIEARNQAREEAQRDYEAAQAEREAWEEKIALAAIQKAEEDQKKEQEAKRDEAKNAELGKAAADIRLAVDLSNGGEGFRLALGYRGYSLAQVSEQEAAAFERARAYAKEIGHHAPSYAAGEMVVMNKYGGIHRLSERNTGKTREEMDKYLIQIKRESLPTVTQARDTIEQERQERAAKAEKYNNAELGKTVADIRLAVQLSKAEELPPALKERCLVLSQVSEQEAAAFESAADEAEKSDQPKPRYIAGELVVMNQFGGTHRLTARTTGKTREEMEKYLAEIKREGLPNAEQGKKEAVMLGQYKYRAELLTKQEQEKAELAKEQTERREQREKEAREFEEKAKQEIDAGLDHLFDKQRLNQSLKENNVPLFGRIKARVNQFIGHKIEDHQAEQRKEKLHKAIVENDWRNIDRDEARQARQDKAHERRQATVEIKQAEAREKLGIHAPERDEALKAAQRTATRTAFNKSATQTTKPRDDGWPDQKQVAQADRERERPAAPEHAAPTGNREGGKVRVIDKATGTRVGLSNGAAAILDGMARPLDFFASSFESLFGAASPPPPRRREPERTPDQIRAAERALSNIHESLQHGDDINITDLRNLPPAHLEGFRNSGDEYLQRLMQRWEYERENERER